MFPEDYLFIYVWFQDLTQGWIEQREEAPFQNGIPRPERGKICAQKISILLHSWNAALGWNASPQRFSFEQPFLGHPNPAARIHCGLEPGRLNLRDGQWFESNICSQNDKQVLQIFIIFCVSIKLLGILPISNFKALEFTKWKSSVASFNFLKERLGYNFPKSALL